MSVSSDCGISFLTSQNSSQISYMSGCSSVLGFYVLKGQSRENGVSFFFTFSDRLYRKCGPGLGLRFLNLHNNLQGCFEDLFYVVKPILR